MENQKIPDSHYGVKELIPPPDVESSLAKMAELPGCLLLESSMAIQSNNPQPLGRYSFLMADPFEQIVLGGDQAEPLEKIRLQLNRYHCQTIDGLPPMQGGIAGLFSYDLNQALEKIPATSFNEFDLPAIAVGIYDTVIAWDHAQNRAWVISQGFPETDLDSRRRRSDQRIAFFLDVINGPVPANKKRSKSNYQLDVSELAPVFEVDGPVGLLSNFSSDCYIDAVQKCIDYIYAGDVFQINLAQRLLHRANCDSVELYRRLRKCNPAPFGGYFDLSGIANRDVQIVSASPERFFSVRDRVVETRPIKGTRRRTGQPMVDIQAREDLLASTKDRAENTMIVDLMRNDLSRVCDDDSICVTQLCELEAYQSVLHLVSAVRGTLNRDCDLVSLLESVFPGGSITGAPKIRAMEIIAELEPTARGAYCGSLGYLGFDGTADLNILIRTITASKGWWQIPVGGGIVSQSNPQREYEETWTKAAGMLRAVTMKDNLP